MQESDIYTTFRHGISTLSSQTKRSTIACASSLLVTSPLTFFFCKTSTIYQKADNAAAQMRHHAKAEHHADKCHIRNKYTFYHQSVYNWIIDQVHNP